jgi:hypothetical protein
VQLRFSSLVINGNIHQLSLLLLLLQLFLMASFDSSDNESYSVPSKLDGQWLACTNLADFFIDSKVRLTMIKEMPNQQI